MRVFHVHLLTAKFDDFRFVLNALLQAQKMLLEGTFRPSEPLTINMCVMGARINLSFIFDIITTRLMF